ncbi:ADP-ribosyltransferase-containing protein [Rhodanobacter lindaniclasticus]
MVDAAGNPLPVYHGTAEEFDTFDPARSGSTTAHMTANLGTFFAEDRAKAQHYAENASQGVPAEERVIDAYLAIRKPYTMSLKQFMGLDSQEESAALRERLVKEGYDGIHIPEVRQWIAFQPNQIKSASENRGTFDTSTGQHLFQPGHERPWGTRETGHAPAPFSRATESVQNMDRAVSTLGEIHAPARQGLDARQVRGFRASDAGCRAATFPDGTDGGAQGIARREAVRRGCSGAQRDEAATAGWRTGCRRASGRHAQARRSRDCRRSASLRAREGAGWVAGCQDGSRPARRLG